MEFAERLLHEARVAVVPGDAFGLGGEGHVRCAYATSIAQIEEALTRIGRFVARLPTLAPAPAGLTPVACPAVARPTGLWRPHRPAWHPSCARARA